MASVAAMATFGKIVSNMSSIVGVIENSAVVESSLTNRAHRSITLELMSEIASQTQAMVFIECHSLEV